MADLLERQFSTGKLKITRDGTCTGFQWTVEWVGIGGNKPQIGVEGSSLIGDNVTIASSTLANGGLLLGPVPAEFLRTPEVKPQVRGISYWFSDWLQ